MGVLGLMLLTYTVQITSFHEAMELGIQFTQVQTQILVLLYAYLLVMEELPCILLREWSGY